MAAKAGLDQARQDAKALEDSPYEWTARVNAQRRTSEPGARSNEWNVGLERTVRLPAKGSADRHIAAATLDEGMARFRGAWRAASRELVDQWLDWLAAREGQSPAMAHQQAAQENLAAVEKRIKAGDASRLDASLARAELAEQQRVGNEERTASAVAWAKLHARFPALPEQVTPVPSAVPLSVNAASLRERIRERNAMLQAAQAQLRKAQAQSERSRAEKVPDPTVGVYTASEARSGTHHWRHTQHSNSRRAAAYARQLGGLCGGNDATGIRAEEARTGRIDCDYVRDDGRGVCRMGDRRFRRRGGEPGAL